MDRTTGRGGCVLVLAACLVIVPWAGRDAPADTVPVDLALVPPSGDINRLTLSVTVIVSGQSKTDSDQTTLSGNALADLAIGFNHATHEARTTGLEFTGGHFTATDVSLSLNYSFMGTVEARATGIAGTFDTPSPPGSVTGTTFPAAEHQAVLNAGTFKAWGTGIIGTMFDPITFNLDDEPMPASGTGTGTLNVSAPQLAGNVATYDVTVELSVDLDEELYNDPPIVARAAGSGKFRASGQFNRTVPILGDVNHDGSVNDADIDRLYDHMPSTDPAYDVTGDWSVNKADMDKLVHDVLASEYGDADLDGDVDFLDYITTKGNFGTATGAGWADGDFDGDDDVDFFDYLTAKGNFGWQAGPGAPPAVEAVPEPAALTLLLLAAPAVLARRRSAS